MRRIALASSLILTWPAASRAAPSTEAAKAQAYVDLAGRLFDARDFAGALTELRRAEPLLSGDPALAVVRFNIARCLEELGRPIEAAEAYETYLAQSDEPRRQARARAALEKLERERLGVLSIRCEPDDAEVEVQGIGARTCPVSLRVLAGAYELEVRRAGYATRRFRYEVVAGTRTEASPALAPMVAPTPAPVSPIVVPAPASVAPVAVIEPEIAEAATRPWLPIALMGAGGALIATGAVFHGIAVGSRDEAAHAPPGPEREDRTSTFETQRGLALGGYALGAIAAGVGAWLYFSGQVEGPSAGLTSTLNGLVWSW
jgi:hypothetical protein